MFTPFDAFARYRCRSIMLNNTAPFLELSCGTGRPLRKRRDRSCFSRSGGAEDLKRRPVSERRQAFFRESDYSPIYHLRLPPY